MTIDAFLSWFLTSGGSIITASWILERVAWFKLQSPDVKEYLFFGLSAVLSVLAYVVVTFVPAEILAQIAPYFVIISGTFVTVIVGKRFHETDKNNSASIKG